MCSVAPEMVLGKKATTKIDCYAFGCMIVEIFSEKNCYHDYVLKNMQIVEFNMLVDD